MIRVLISTLFFATCLADKLVCAQVNVSQESFAQRSVVNEIQESVQVKVRMLRADDKSIIGFKSFVNNTKLDPAISDLKDKLESLPFEHFTLASSDERSIPLKKKETIQFAGGQVLHLRPLSIEGDKVSLWLSWEDAKGQSILDTRMHFDSSQSMLAGTDNTDNTGLLLAISVRP